MLLGRSRYDVITADIIQPTHAGAGMLYSREYFALARRALTERGVMVQWIGLRSRLHYALMYLREAVEADARLERSESLA